MTDIMKLATDYAQACYNLANPDSYDAELADEARAALQSAIEALQKEVSTLDVLLEECKMDWSGDVTQLKAEHKREIDAMQSKLGDAIQSSAHWQHQCTELQAENERLIQEQSAWRRFTEMANNTVSKAEAERDQLQSRLDAMGKGEAVAYIQTQKGGEVELVWDKDEELEGELYAYSPLYTAPKALAPRITECRIELVTAIHTLASHYENRLGRLDPEDRKLAENDIAHAMATAVKWNWNGNGIGGTHER